VLLSCSHLFHENCILSFERFLSTTVVSTCIAVPTC
jgi:putative component of membrane protein insertase Oxa1/YidC/SpoIIIJ protein YidD